MKLLTKVLIMCMFPAVISGCAGTKNPVATIEMESGGIIKVELYPGKAPNTVANFIALANDGFYDGLIFHRVISNFMIQGGGFTAEYEHKELDYSITGEFLNNNYKKNDISHKRGVISMARVGGYNDSASSQFFICVEDISGPKRGLDGDYAAFGAVVEGMDEVDKIKKVKTGKNAVTGQADWPVENQVIKTITVDTFGKDYGEPKKVK